MTKAIQGGEEWVYTYNEEGLPLTIETIWGGIPTSEPMILTLTYQKIEAGK